MCPTVLPWNKTSGLFKSWEELQKDPILLCKILRGLSDNESCCLYVRKQNCAIYFTQMDKQNIRIITFRPMLPSQEITTASGSLLVTYPETVDIIPKSDLLLSECFSNQICHLTNNTCGLAMPHIKKAGKMHEDSKEPSSPCVVSEFLVSMLSPVDSSTFGNRGCRDMLKIEKKIRDQVNWKPGSPFRRSGLWTSVKVILTLSLNEDDNDCTDARLLYKLIVLEVLIDIVNDYWKVRNNTVQWDIGSQIMVKLARRAKKITSLPISQNVLLENQRQQTLQKVFTTVNGLSSFLLSQWNQTIVENHDMPIQKIRRSNDDWEKDCVYIMDELSNYINQISQTYPGTFAVQNMNWSVDVEALLPPVTLDGLISSAINNHQEWNWLHQAETFVRRQLNECDRCEKVYELLVKYVNTANSCGGYNDKDPVSRSRMVVTVFRIWHILDKITVQRHRLISSYGIGFHEVWFENLLLPDKNDMWLVAELVAYFNERNKQAKKGDWLTTSVKDGNEFPCEFAEKNLEMRKVKGKILFDMDEDVRAKMVEIEKARRKCAALREQIKSQNHTSVWNSYYNQNFHSSKCTYCLLNKSLEETKVSVQPYERPLPSDDKLQNSVVFELCIPLELAILRDASIVFLEDVLGIQRLPTLGEESNIKVKWMETTGLGRYSKTGYQKLCHLGSDAKETKLLYIQNNPDIDGEDSAFILNNGLKCMYFRSSPVEKVHPSPFTFSIGTTKEKELYKTLQFALQTKPATENEVISMQYNCHPKLSLREFKAFGCLRCANKIQLRNLYVEIASRVLPLEKEPVLQLIMQTIWELGPGQRENHVDFENLKNEPFVEAFLEMMETICDENAENWTNPTLMMSLTVITVRILTMSTTEKIRQKSAELLHKYRGVLQGWSKQLEDKITQSHETDELKSQSEAQLKCAISSMLTFDVTEENLHWVLRNESDIINYLHSLSTLNKLILRRNVLSLVSPSMFIQNLLRDTSTRIPLKLREFLVKLLGIDNFNRALHTFVCDNWIIANEVVNHDIPLFKSVFCDDATHFYKTKYTIHNQLHEVNVDILHGTFFVDGFEPSTLPESIIGNEMFTLFFRSSLFRVQRVSKTFKTVDKYRGNHYEFIECNRFLCIRELHNNLEYYELLPKYLLQKTGSFPPDLINNYTHWYSSKSKDVYFRCRSLDDAQENIEQDTHYRLVPVSLENNMIGSTFMWHLVNHEGPTIQPSFKLLSCTSVGFSQVVNGLLRLEDQSFIHVEQSIWDKKITVNLLRLGLSFTLNPMDGLLYCKNYPDFYIPPSNSICGKLGTLVGLRNGVVLEKEHHFESSSTSQILLVPHGSIKVDEGNYHQTVSISMNSPGNPMYFAYEVDPVLKRLKPGNSKSAWLYLALLHGATSSPFPDPFTQLTGTEMAIWLLQSAFSWSCAPYDRDCQRILRQIAELSPSYEYYPSQTFKIMQKTTWPTGLKKHSYAAYDGYVLVVDKLIEDSTRLEGLFQTNSIKFPRCNIDELQLGRKAYNRNINIYNYSAHITTAFIPEMEDNNQNLFLPPSTLYERVTEVATFAKYRLTRAPVQTNQSIASLLLIDKPLPYATENNLSCDFLPLWLNTHLRENWFRLYSLAKKQYQNGNKNIHELSLMLGAMIYSGKGTLQQVVNLHNVEVSNHFPITLESPITTDYNPGDKHFVENDVIHILRIHASKPKQRNEFATYELYNTACTQHEFQLSSEAKSAAALMNRRWPAFEITDSQIKSDISGKTRLNFTDSLASSIRNLFLKWFNNHQLSLFVQDVDLSLSQLTSGQSLELVSQPIPTRFQFKVKRDTSDLWIPHQFPDPPTITGIDRISKGKDCQDKIQSVTDQLMSHMSGGSLISQALEKAGIYQRLAPVVLLREHWTSNISSYIKMLAVLWSNLKMIKRLLRYSSDPAKFSTELTREMEVFESESWNPSENSEWLLLELEMDITIRKIQVEVAKQMMQMPNNSNGVMQLNMGEGKTSVIIPMIVSTLSSNRDVLCRVTVLSSIFTTNFNLLAVTIGGLTNKRLYTIPCNREINIAKYIDEMNKTYKECLELGGVVITLPEYRLSFRLQMYNHFLRGDFQLGMKIFDVESWLRRFARDLVDESDEVFSIKYQLIYTTGQQQNLDGKSIRWTVCQKLLELVPQVATNLIRIHGDKSVEFQVDKSESNPHRFFNVRILSDDCKQDFVEKMAEDILDGKVNLLRDGMLTSEKRALVKEFLTNESITENRHKEFMASEDLSPEMKTILLLVSGYLRHGILFAALRKRWRVDYGVRVAKAGHKPKLTAVPFRAKDVAAERSEFGHPDMAIVLTQLSYFYAGLRDDELWECFTILDRQTSAAEVYKSWISKIPVEHIRSDTVKTYQGVNLQDYQQRTKFLFPMLRFHTSVINFWLDNVTFPRESKQFPGKLITNAFDLCYEGNSQVTTGFSGTNDTSILLPAQIKQQDLAYLEETNVRVEEILRRPENTWKRSLKMGDGCDTIISSVINDECRVFIDSGALMLELGNAGVAERWLHLDQTLEAVVYFNQKGEMTVKVRGTEGRKQNTDTLLTLSSFKDRLERCAVYLDDQHTRGTDIRLPRNFKACVTVGSGMRRDKLIQACMRMRKLGKGQSVHFYLSHEVDTKIRQWKDAEEENITVSDILEWCKHNSNEFQKDGLVHWAINARNYSKNFAADQIFEVSGKNLTSGAKLGKLCEDPDAQSINEMYGSFQNKILVPQAIPQWFAAVAQRLSPIPSNIQEKLANMKDSVVDKCQTQIPDQIYFQNILDEEQEKELEPEQEQEAEVHRPSSETACQPRLHPHVLQIVKQGLLVSKCEGISELFSMFTQTSVRSHLELDLPEEVIFVTEDFKNTIETFGNDREVMDDFLKCIRFVVSFNTQEGHKLLVLSQFEADALVDLFRRGESVSGARLHLFSGRWMTDQPIFLNEPRLQLPAGSDTTSPKISEDIVAPLLTAAGNLYFCSETEEKAFVRYFGIALKPWSEKELEAFNMKMITKGGFVLPSLPELRQGCKFQKDPTEMARKILSLRNATFQDDAHVIRVLDTCSSALVPSPGTSSKGRRRKLESTGSDLPEKLAKRGK